MKDALKNDRARIQVGRISSFGLMEMSRQRLRTGVLEATTRQCPHCDGTGLVRTASSAGLSALRLIEDEAAKGKGTTITLHASTEAAIYLLNAKRADLAEIEHRYGVTVEVVPEGEEEGAKMRVSSSGPRPTSTPRFEPIVEEVDDLDLIDEEEDEDEEEEREERGSPRERDSGERGGKRRRRRGGRGRDREREPGDEQVAEDRDEGEEADGETEREHTQEGGEDRPKKRRRRGGRRRNKHREGQDDGTSNEEVGEEAELIPEATEAPGTEDVPVAGASLETAEAETPKRRSRRKKAVEEAIEAAPVAEDEPSRMAPTGEEAPVVEAEAKPKRRSRAKKPVPSEVEEAPVEEAPVEAAVVEEPKADAPAKPKRSRSKKPQPAEAAPEPAAVAANDANGDEPAADAPRRSGWWSRTFGE
jgi:ribonuclease E